MATGKYISYLRVSTAKEGASAQRMVRAKAVIRDKAIPYHVPVSQELSARLVAVLPVVYLIFNGVIQQKQQELN
jgi:RNA polymerase sigma-70 factor (ECF subfamily)